MANSQVPSSQTYAVQNPKNYLAAEVEQTKQITQDKPQILAVGTVAAAGSDETDAAAIPDYPLVSVTAADGTKGVILPPSGAGKVIEVYNVANAALKVYPPAGGNLNGGSANAALSVGAKSPGRFICVTGTLWAASGVS